MQLACLPTLVELQPFTRPLLPDSRSISSRLKGQCGGHETAEASDYRVFYRSDQCKESSLVKFPIFNFGKSVTFGRSVCSVKFAFCLVGIVTLI